MTLQKLIFFFLMFLIPPTQRSTHFLRNVQNFMQCCSFQEMDDGWRSPNRGGAYGKGEHSFFVVVEVRYMFLVKDSTVWIYPSREGCGGPRVKNYATN